MSIVTLKISFSSLGQVALMLVSTVNSKLTASSLQLLCFIKQL